MSKTRWFCLLFLIIFVAQKSEAVTIKVPSQTVGPSIKKRYIDDLEREVILSDLDGDAIIDLVVIIDHEGRQRFLWNQLSSLEWTNQKGDISAEYFLAFRGSSRVDDQEKEAIQNIDAGIFQQRFALIADCQSNAEPDFFPALTEVEAQEILLNILEEERVKSSCFILGFSSDDTEKLLQFALKYIKDVIFLRELYVFYSEHKFSGAKQVALAIKAKTPKKRRYRLREIGDVYNYFKPQKAIG